MSSPRVTLDNHREVIEHYGNKKPVAPLMRAVHLALAAYIRTDTVYEEGAAEEIHDHLKGGGQLIIAANHQEFYDPLVLASMLQREKVFRKMRTRTNILSNAVLFNHQYFGSVVRNSGAQPFFRPKDVDVDDVIAKLTEQPPHNQASVEALRRTTNKQSLRNMGRFMDDYGFHAAGFPEGTRGKHIEDRDPRVVRQPLFDGLAKLACGLRDPHNARFVAVGIAYHPNPQDHRHPKVGVVRPFEAAETPELVMERLAPSMQASLDLAFAHADRAARLAAA